jgi:hypothetical protein
VPLPLPALLAKNTVPTTLLGAPMLVQFVLPLTLISYAVFATIAFATVGKIVSYIVNLTNSAFESNDDNELHLILIFLIVLQDHLFQHQF